MCYLGLDLGTSGLRGILIDQDGNAIGSSEYHYTVNCPHSGWAEQDPANWVTALDHVISDLKTRFPRFADLRAIGVSGHMHGATLLDKGGNVLRPCILWNDTRSDAQAKMLDAMPEFRSISGNIVFAGFTAPKLLWLKENEPHIYEQTKTVLLPAAYLNFVLTGTYVSDLSDSSGTSWLDVRNRKLASNLLEVCGLSADMMPELVEGCCAAGVLKSELAKRWGVNNNVVVAGGAGDNAAAACGIGVLTDGQGFVSLGTSGVVLAGRTDCEPSPETAVHTFCHAVPDRWYQMGVMLSATDSLNWLSRLVDKSPKDLTSALSQDLKPPSSLRYFPYLSGERTPHNDPMVRAGFYGIDQRSDVRDMTQAVLEGVAFGLRDCAEALMNTGAQFERLYVIGGGAASDYWVKLLATVLNIPLERPVGGEFGAALGAARLGMVAALGVAPETVMRPPTSVEIFEPVADLVVEFDRAYKQFKSDFSSHKNMSSRY